MISLIHIFIFFVSLNRIEIEAKCSIDFDNVNLNGKIRDLPLECESNSPTGNWCNTLSGYETKQIRQKTGNEHL